MSSESKKSLLDRVLGGAKKKTENNKGKFEAQVKETLKGLVYEDELVDELAPVFMEFYGKEGFDKVVELLETKEQQIEYISGGDWFKQETDPDHKEEHESDDDDESSDESTLNSVTEILDAKYETKG